VDQGLCRERGIPVVRRPTGGAAVLHDREVTYCLVGSTFESPFTGSLLESYRRIASGIAAGLSLLGVQPDPRVPATSVPRKLRPEQCFARTSSYEITFEGRKIVGSAQVRRKGAALQHGSILLDANPDLFDMVSFGPRSERRGWTTLRMLLGRKPLHEEVALAVARGLGQTFGVQWNLGTTESTEERLAEALRARKYLNAHWTARGTSTLSHT
jgi:lipoate-protein ligase A